MIYHHSPGCDDRGDEVWVEDDVRMGGRTYGCGDARSCEDITKRQLVGGGAHYYCTSQFPTTAKHNPLLWNEDFPSPQINRSRSDCIPVNPWTVAQIAGAIASPPRWFSPLVSWTFSLHCRRRRLWGCRWGSEAILTRTAFRRRPIPQSTLDQRTRFARKFCDFH